MIIHMSNMKEKPQPVENPEKSTKKDKEIKVVKKDLLRQVLETAAKDAKTAGNKQRSKVIDMNR